MFLYTDKALQRFELVSFSPKNRTIRTLLFSYKGTLFAQRRSLTKYKSVRRFKR